MDFFKLGLRNVIGITLPGALLILSFAYVFLSVAAALRLQFGAAVLIKDHQLLAFAVFFLLSYILGMMMRLNAADSLDRSSSERLLGELDDVVKGQAEKFEEQWRALGEGHSDADALHEFARREKGFDDWVWLRDEFPYPVWESRKFRLYHPPEVSRFFEGYKSCMGIGPGRRGKEFFNYCKMVVQHAGREAGAGLTEELHFAEAVVRFYAGTYYALRISTRLLLPLLAFQLLMLGLPWALALSGRPAWPAWATADAASVIGALASAVFAFALWRMSRMIERRFRRLRLKEVDTVYDAFYLVHRHAQSCDGCAPPAPAAAPEYAEREKLLKGAYRAGASGGVLRLEDLTRAMRDGSRGRPFLSSLYFAGAEGDHPFFLQNEAVAVGLSVLPEDAAKAGRSKRHPHQREVIVVLSGSLFLDYEKGGKVVPLKLGRGDVRVIEPGQCHRIRPSEGEAVYLFVKTDPAREPRGDECELVEVSAPAGGR